MAFFTTCFDSKLSHNMRLSHAQPIYLCIDRVHLKTAYHAKSTNTKVLTTTTPTTPLPTTIQAATLTPTTPTSTNFLPTAPTSSYPPSTTLSTTIKAIFTTKTTGSNQHRKLKTLHMIVLSFGFLPHYRKGSELVHFIN